MNLLVDLLHNGGYTLVVGHCDEVRTFSQRGVADLMDLLEKDPAFLQGAWIADKVVGKAAAALMIKGGVVRLHTDTLSQPAFELLIKMGQSRWSMVGSYLILRTVNKTVGVLWKSCLFIKILWKRYFYQCGILWKECVIHKICYCGRLKLSVRILSQRIRE